MRKAKEPIQSSVPEPGLSALDLAKELLSRIDVGNSYARTRKNTFRSASSSVRLASMLLSVASTIILGLQHLNTWTGIAFALVATITTVSALEPFFAWRARWVLMEEAQAKFYRLRDELTYYIAASQPDGMDEVRIRQMFDQYQHIWYELNSGWLEFRKSAGQGGYLAS